MVRCGAVRVGHSTVFDDHKLLAEPVDQQPVAERTGLHLRDRAGAYPQRQALPARPSCPRRIQAETVQP
jgi:hypothetical protein